MPLICERTLAHGVWATSQWWSRLEESDLSEPLRTQVVAELCHMVRAEEVWLERVGGSAAPAVGAAGETQPFWPAWGLEECRERHARVSAELLGLAQNSQRIEVSYTNSKGEAFSNLLEDLLLHVSVHGQFHRGRASAALRTAGVGAPVGDYIAFVREGGGRRTQDQKLARKTQATWGRGTLDNQPAEDWLDEFVAAPADSKLAAAFAAFEQGGLDDPEASAREARAVAAAEVVAARAARGKPGLAPTLLAWSLGHSAGLDPSLIQTAADALGRIESESALAQYWLNEGGLLAWRRGLEALRERLTS
ncbi:MAG: putative damage-inducible protein DinB [Planctomycetota bacterium]|jgi:uncharacterized damage-inducible protein DinB